MVIAIATVTFTESRTGRLTQPMASTRVTTSLPGMSTTLALGQKRMNSLFRRMRQELIRPAVEVCHPLSGPRDQNEFGGRPVTAKTEFNKDV